MAVNRLVVQSVNDAPLDELFRPVYVQANHKIPKVEASALRGDVFALFGMLRHNARCSSGGSGAGMASAHRSWTQAESC